MTGSKAFWIDSDRHLVRVHAYSPEIVEAARANATPGIFMNGWDQPDLVALLPLRDQITFLSVQPCRPQPNLAAVSEFTRLEKLYLRSGADVIDFSRLAELKELAIWADAPRFGNLAEARSLRRLSITDCGLGDLRPLSNLSQLTWLSIQEAPLRSLDGLEGLTSLETLMLHQVPLDRLDALRIAPQLARFSLSFVRRITSIAPLCDLAALRSVVLWSARKITDLERLGGITTLESLDVDGADLKSGAWISQLTQLQTLKLENVGTIPSLGFLAHLTRLDRFSFGGKSVIADSDLSILLRLPALREVRVGHGKRYSPTSDEIREALSARHASE